MLKRQFRKSEFLKNVLGLPCLLVQKRMGTKKQKVSFQSYNFQTKFAQSTFIWSLI